jgi:flavin-dependent trigonelline monooxygenase, reductase component
MDHADQLSPPATPPIDPRRLRAALGTFVTGVTILATRDPQDGSPRGLTANSFTSVSLTPPLILVCIGLQSSSCEAFRAAGHFSVNVLAEDQHTLARAFASRTTGKFANVPHRTVHTGAPLLDGTLGWLDCETHQAFEAGDHLVLIGRVVAFDHATGAPLGYFRGGFTNLRVAS